MVRTCYTLLTFICSITLVTAQDCEQSRAFEIFHGNDIRTIVSNGGDLFWDLDQNTFQVPFSGAETPSMIFAGGIWLAGFDAGGNLRIAAQQYRYNERNDYAPGPLDATGMTDAQACETWDRIWKVVRHDIQTHLADYADDQVVGNPNAAIFSWPGAGNQFFLDYNGFLLPELEHLSAPFHDRNDNGIYEPDLGEYPLPEQVDPGILPMVMTWSVFNDAGALHSNSMGDPLHAEVQLTTYAFSCDESSNLDQTLFTSYKIVNRSQVALDSFVFGQWLDPDLGCYVDDYFGSYPDGNSFFVYNEDPVDGDVGSNCPLGISTYAEHPPVLSVTFLNQAMTSMAYYYNSGLWGGPAAMVDPLTPMEFFNYLTGRWRDGTPITAAGLGYDPLSTDTTNFAFPDNPTDPDGWSMYNNGISGDRRLIGAARWGRLEPGDAVTVDLAFAYHLDSTLNHVQNVEPMYETIDQLIGDYATGFAGLCTYAQDVCIDDCVYPGDADGDGRVTFHDFLNIAVALTDTGSERSGPLAWLPHTVPDWPGTNVMDFNSKHADCDGNGVVTDDDFAIAELNYGLMNPYYNPEDNQQYGDEIRVVPESGVMEVGEALFKVSVELVVPELDSLYGLAYTLNYDPVYYRAAIAQDHNPPVAGASVYHDLKMFEGRFESISVATDLNNKRITETELLEIVLFGEDDVEISGGSDTVYFEVTDVKAVLSDGSVLDLHGQKVPVVIVDGISATRQVQDDHFRIYPNPSSGEVCLWHEQHADCQFAIVSADGRIVVEGKLKDGRSTVILQEGVYLIRLFDDDHVIQTKLVVTGE